MGVNMVGAPVSTVARTNRGSRGLEIGRVGTGIRTPPAVGVDRAMLWLQPERVGAETMTAEAIGVEVEFELFDPILGRSTVVIPGDEIGRRAAAVGDHEADVEPLRGDVDFDQNASVMRPGPRAMPKARAKKDGPTGPIVPRLCLRHVRRHAALEDTVGADAEQIPEALRFQFRFDRGRRHAGIAPQQDRRARKAGRKGGSSWSSSSSTHVALRSSPGRKRVRSNSPVRPSNQTSG